MVFIGIYSPENVPLMNAVLVHVQAYVMYPFNRALHMMQRLACGEFQGVLQRSSLALSSSLAFSSKDCISMIMSSFKKALSQDWMCCTLLQVGDDAVLL